MLRILFIVGLIFLIAYRILPFLYKYFSQNKNNHNQQPNRNSAQDINKHFTKDVGEYVSYEEVKEEDK